jgi:ABC-type transport system involved in multi-copper enzyme maturation permease subunit
MPETLSREAAPQLLHYRPWSGELRPPAAAVWPIARTALGMMVRRKLFWVLYALGLIFFLLFFFGQYLLAFAEAQALAGSGGGPGGPLRLLRSLLNLDGTGASYRTFFGYQGYTVMVILALAGATVIGNDLRFGSLPFYLAKPVSRAHYLAGKALAVAVFVNLLTTLPALVLFVQYGLLPQWEGYDYFTNKARLALGIVAYGAVLTASLSMVLLAAAMWLRKTVPLIMVWSTLFFFCRVVTEALVRGLNFDKHLRLFDLWNDTYVVGSACLGEEPTNLQYQPDWYWAALVLGGVSLTCLTYLILRIRAVEIVR